MLCLSRKTQYALIALGHLAEQQGRVASAREIAQQHDLPLSLLMNILKSLQGHGLLRSTRGVKGGYEIQANLGRLSLHDLILIVECTGHHENDGECGCLDHHEIPPAESSGPLEALQIRLNRFLKDVRVADLVQPGRRIDVPLERLTRKDLAKTERSLAHAHFVD